MQNQHQTLLSFDFNRVSVHDTVFPIDTAGYGSPCAPPA